MSEERHVSQERHVPEKRHCRHCYGDCQGVCLSSTVPGRCIHGWDERPPRQFQLRWLLRRGWWHRVFWGAR
jgi:hypothetical protein